ncbi:hypothetical protein [Dactylosporangium sp. CA-139066]|uniref:hypothetical protein n=1 Tax=Dactylosporangium sp. CA-139066 TaxID=3239930 RepID=UPI003D91ED8A
MAGVKAAAWERIEVATLLLLTLTGLFALIAVADIAALLAVIPGLPTPSLSLLENGQRIGTAETFLFYTQLLAAVAWYALATLLVRSRDGDPDAVLRTRTVVFWRIGAAVVVAAGFALPHATLADEHGFTLRLELMIPLLVARLALTVPLVIAVLRLRPRLRELLFAAA